MFTTAVVGHEGSEGRPHTLVHAARLPPVVDVDVRERADRGRVIHSFGEEPELVRRARRLKLMRRPTSTGVGTTNRNRRKPRPIDAVDANVRDAAAGRWLTASSI